MSIPQHVTDTEVSPDPDRHIYLEGECLHLPPEFVASLGILEGDTILIEPEVAGCFFISHSRQFRVLKMRLLGCTFWQVKVRHKQPGEWIAEIPIACADALEDNCFHIVNYHPRYYLMPMKHSSDSGQEEGQDRARFWASIPDYHEHLPPATQDASAHRISEWFARDVIAPLKPSSVLEAGCGAGRNLVHIKRQLPGVIVAGIDVNPGAVKTTSKLTGAGDLIRVLSVYDIPSLPGDFDVVFSMGVLMHIPHTRILEVIKILNEKSRIATVHFELYGQSHIFDFHRYPRDYQAIYKQLPTVGEVHYQVFPRGDFRNAGESVGSMSLLVNRKLQDGENGQ